MTSAAIAKHEIDDRPVGVSRRLCGKDCAHVGASLKFSERT
jgi:hypothetical protein